MKSRKKKGIEMQPFPTIYAQKFFPCRLNELLDYTNYVVQNYVKNLTVLQVADDIITKVRYPFFWGTPDDMHWYRAFHGKYRYYQKIARDYWQNASETLSILVGDCEDSSIAFVGALHALGIKQIYEIFGVVKEAGTGKILGGHGWSAFWHEGCFRLYESTLDTPPAEGYPEYGKSIDDLKKPLLFGKIIYDPDWVWNAYEIHFLVGTTLRKQLRETIEKWKAIEEAWGQRTKVLKEMDKTSNKIRRAFRAFVCKD